MSTQREGVNPLRPYYKPPTIGESPDPTAASSGPNPFARHAGNATTGRYASKARDIFSDIDYKDYISEPSPSVVQTVKDLVDELLWKYTSVLMAQPFEVAKTVLQVRSHDDVTLGPAIPTPITTPVWEKRQSVYGNTMYDEAESDSDLDEPAYFTSNVPATPTPSFPRDNRNHQPSPPRTPAAKQPVPPHQLTIRRPDSLMEVIGQLWQKEGAWGVWKGSNATFLYSVLSSLLENWSRSALSALFNVPDLGVKEDIDRLIDIASPYPWASLCVAAAAAVATGLILAPLDMVRTRLLVTPTSKQPRRTLSTLRALPSYVCPSPLVIPTILHSLIHPLLTLSTPLVLRTRFLIDSRVSPTTFSVAKFCASSVALFVKLPLETVLRRGQAAVLSTTPYIRALAGKDQKLETIIPLGRYNGVMGTMFYIMNEEGTRAIATPPPPVRKGKSKPKVAETVFRKGQGLDGLWRGWKVSWWGLVGLWTAGVIGNSAEGEF
ncbi:mitochondrial fusion protein [Colletotrichum truncatum]|uniref:Mitochondrial fusion protein n=1 Tax=Colletotrichum truncatum TaxID=5467 RepID=A0ACC3ZGH0_COLTU|nr:mitochondrial fusion protein [Colletotrichum truncatum]KAF6784713.1 mitochondrial fusion protein [Colletotrichum truncatum]